MRASSRLCKLLMVGGALLIPSAGYAEETASSSASAGLSLTPSLAPAAAPQVSQTPTSDDAPAYLDMAPEAPNIHGFFNSPFKTAYVTPRGLVVQNAGLVWQPIVGLVIPIGDLGPVKNFALVGGIWNSVDTAESGSNPQTGAWDEMDVFVSVGGKVADKVKLDLTYGAWNSPEHAFATEHNIDLKITLDDSKCAMWGSSGFSLNPYVDLWWAVSGDSTVILGKKGDTGYVELGVAPSYTFKPSPEYPITLTLPTYISVGPKTYWDRSGSFDDSNFGLFSASLNASMPLAFIPTKYGFWHADAGVTYDYLLSDALLAAGGLASGNDNRNVVILSVGFGFGF
ncbi:hypothetical protein BH10PLA1_BH10PLA1_23090 [soil metagenome]